MWYLQPEDTMTKANTIEERWWLTASTDICSELKFLSCNLHINHNGTCHNFKRYYLSQRTTTEEDKQINKYQS